MTNEVEAAGVEGCGEFFDQLVADGLLQTWMKNNSVRWVVEQEGGRRIEDVLDKLLNTVVHRLDADMNDVITANDFTLAEKVRR